jgi:hypothetical protein
VDGVGSFRERLLKRYPLVVATLGFAYLAGFDVSPAFDAVSFYLASFARGTRFFHPEVFYHLTSLAISVMTLLLAGVPAALYERARGLQQSTPASLLIWLAATLLLTLPVLLRLLAPMEE